MPRKVVRKERGVFEKVPGSDIWWIRFKVAGVEHREKVGRRGDAIKLYKIRKADILRGVKMPANMKDKGIKFSVLAQEAIDWYVNHDRRDVRNFKGRMKFILEAFADRVADEIKPSDIDTWISSHKWSPATKNRYKNVFGKTYKIALADGKVTSNPARLVEQRAENNARIRFLSENEEKTTTRRNKEKVLKTHAGIRCSTEHGHAKERAVQSGMVPGIADAETHQIGEDEERKRPRDPAEQDLPEGSRSVTCHPTTQWPSLSLEIRA